MVKSEGPPAFPAHERATYLLDDLRGHSHQLTQIHGLTCTLKGKVKVREAQEAGRLQGHHRRHCTQGAASGAGGHSPQHWAVSLALPGAQ